jgi:hypothetical protein
VQHDFCGPVAGVRPRARERIGSARVLHEPQHQSRRGDMNGIIYLIGLVVVIMAILSFLGLH